MNAELHFLRWLSQLLLKLFVLCLWRPWFYSRTAEGWVKFVQICIPWIPIGKNDLVLLVLILCIPDHGKATHSGSFILCCTFSLQFVKPKALKDSMWNVLFFFFCFESLERRLLHNVKLLFLKYLKNQSEMYKMYEAKQLSSAPLDSRSIWGSLFQQYTYITLGCRWACSNLFQQLLHLGKRPLYDQTVLRRARF